MSQRTVVDVNVPGAPYPATVQPGLLARVGPVLRELGIGAGRRICIVTDSAVGPLYLAPVEQSLREAGFEPVAGIIPTGEANKTLTQIGRLYDAFLSAGIERGTPLLTLGGGVVGDMGGFTAATLLRGIPFVQCPTTLLSMVDASVGGKTGIDHPAGKNLIGAFHQPRAVLIDPAVLRTLPPRELRSGLAECIKHEIIRDAEGFGRLEQSIGRALALDVEYLAELVAHNVGIKARVVAADPFEKGERAHLNFGHTFGHAIESVSGFSYAHGEAVALGMLAACRAAVHLGMFDSASAGRIERLIAAAGLPVGGMRLEVDAVIAAMGSDKKVKGGKVRFVLPEAIGKVVLRDDVPADVIRAAVTSLRD